ncbi:hypothetical protein Pmani_037359 [Petrolisthes manimaculis]|uniref:Uncharacterized protein n=1 Tax=Petrolisthes manimaculis TaxID=1843537 RepID=A0AAE1NHU0_9EUCA|nr:hypothetical protein Pmani_037359 [Petrolisthes manimaculis]
MAPRQQLGERGRQNEVTSGRPPTRKTESHQPPTTTLPFTSIAYRVEAPVCSSIVVCCCKQAIGSEEDRVGMLSASVRARDSWAVSDGPGKIQEVEEQGVRVKRVSYQNCVGTVGL